MSAMESKSGPQGEGAGATEELLALQQFAGEPKQFWPAYLSAVARLVSADVAALVLGQPGKTPRWGKLGEWTSSPGPSSTRTPFTSQLEKIAEHGLNTGSFIEANDPKAGTFTAAVRVKLSRPEDELILAVQLKDFTEAAASEALVRLQLAANVPAVYQLNLVARQAKHDAEKFAAVLDLNVPVNQSTQFFPAALAFCNGIATRFQLSRASLGWLEGGYIRLRAMSRTEQFNRQMAAAQSLEAAMEECLDQDEEIVWPVPEGVTSVARAHEAYEKDQKPGNVVSVPLRVDNKVVGVLTCERPDDAFNPAELQQIRLSCDQVARRLSELKLHDRWFGARWMNQARDWSAQWLGPEHTWSKVTGIGGAILLALLFLVHVNYRVEGDFILRSDQAGYLTAPFDGYIEQVFVRPGDVVTNGEALMSLNRSELLLQQSAAMADLARYQRAAEKDRAANNIADMRIDEAQAAQVKAQLDLVRYRLDHATVHAEFDGALVEGDLRERIGSPVKQGDALFKVARIDTLYAEADIHESDVQRILGKSKGEIAFVAQPKIKFPVTIQAIEPAAVTKKDGNMFLARLKPAGAVGIWWRPGMTGTCKLSAEKESLFWILTHRTVDFLRMKLWW